ncbi:hypothetical protein HDE68_004430 [Pedobacter cryoconitis]|uniref:Uncharacterized protein n=1 Tax=Pedobacter cryoconitis TaxID=188932 RepID=A0A7W9E110_9SPHI|nr:hypothetical protein [Pedobacter cryoconitis]MBB5638498.1 hypothetical protein [Pedobacter cryoconitis]
MPVGTPGGGGGGGNMATLSSSYLENATIVNDNKPKIDPEKYIRCFNDGKPAKEYKMTIYINQPNPGSNDQWTSDINSNIGQGFITPGGQIFNVGHTFVSFIKVNTDGSSVTQVMGFYPGGLGLKSPGIVKDDGGHAYNVSYTSSVTVDQFNLSLNTVINDSKNTVYNLGNYIFGGVEYNCTDAASAWMGNAGIRLPAGVARGLFTNTPGDYGQVLSNVNGANKSPGKAPQSHGECN